MIPFILAFGPVDTLKLLQKLAIHRQLNLNHLVLVV